MEGRKVHGGKNGGRTMGRRDNWRETYSFWREKVGWREGRTMRGVTEGRKNKSGRKLLIGGKGEIKDSKCWREREIV